MELKVIKRDGRVKDFDLDRITNAISKAYLELNKENEFKNDISCGLIEDIESSVYANKREDNQISIEEIQNIIEQALKSYNNDVYKAYKNYRSKRTSIRELQHSLTKSINGLIDNSNIDVLTENSNKQSSLASTRRDLIAGEVSKYITSTQMIPKLLMDAHKKGILKLHDLDYYLEGITNCELVDLKDMFENGTVINKKMIETPKSLRTAMTLATQIAAQISSFTYGGQTMSLSHIAPYVRVSKEKYIKEIEEENIEFSLNLSKEQIDKLVQKKLKSEIKDAVQTFNYQLLTLNGTNGQSPFLSLAMYISEDEEYEEEVVMLIEELFKQRIEGMKNEYGVKATQTFPKLLYFLDTNNTYVGSKYYYLTELAAKCCAKRMSPDFISVKRMKDVHGYAYPCMG